MTIVPPSEKQKTAVDYELRLRAAVKLVVSGEKQAHEGDKVGVELGMDYEESDKENSPSKRRRIEMNPPAALIPDTSEPSDVRPRPKPKAIPRKKLDEGAGERVSEVLGVIDPSLI